MIMEQQKKRIEVDRQSKGKLGILNNFILRNNITQIDKSKSTALVEKI